MDIRYTIQLCRTIATGIWVHSMNLSSKAFGMYLECISICLGLLIGILASAFCFLVILPIIFTLLFFVITFTLVILYLYSLDNEQNNHSADNNQDEYQLLQQNQPHDEGDNAPELFQDKSDEEIQLQPLQGAHNTRHTCVICMDREPQVVLVPCGHQNLCTPCAYQWKEENGRCPTDRREIEMIVTIIPL